MRKPGPLALFAVLVAAAVAVSFAATLAGGEEEEMETKIDRLDRLIDELERKKADLYAEKDESHIYEMTKHKYHIKTYAIADIVYALHDYPVPESLG